MRPNRDAVRPRTVPRGADRDGAVREETGGGRAPLDGALEDSLAFYAFPREHWKMLRTNNPLERLMKEIRRRTKVAEQFPHEESALLLVTARLKRI
jgi:hypothetical protein